MDSPFAQHLNTNYAPSDPEIKHIQSHLIPHVLEVSRLDSLIRRLSAQRERTVEYIEAHKALLTPARRLPPDVVQEIFIACLPIDRNAVMSTTEAPLLLTCICSAWRTLALSIPALWASLHLPMGIIHRRGVPISVEKWLERSGGCPLSLSLRCGRSVGGDDFDTVMRAFEKCSDRWRSIDLAAYFGEEPEIPLLAEIYAPWLEALKIRTHDASNMVKMKLLTTPTLRAVALYTLKDFDRWMPRLPLHWAHLTSLKFESLSKDTIGERSSTLQGLSPTVVIEILARCPRLIHFETDLINFQGDRLPRSTATVSLPELQKFIVCRCGRPVNPVFILYLLRHLVMPQLRHLQLPCTDSSATILPYLGDLATRSLLIEDLSIDLTGLTHESLSNNLLALPYLQKLVVLDSNARPLDAGATIRQLIVLFNSTTPPICPVLQELKLARFYQPDLTNAVADLLNFARQRLDHGGSPFRRLDVEYQYHTPLVWPRDAANFLARGLIISTTCPPSTPRVPVNPWMGLNNLSL
ncbi:hypothetical protein B0H13DRAFT_2649502 [Mycena leptocephala]|nr:hypothetical protein B0H13DRAFT_2649502 [Mycena leptocephala]